MKGFRKLDSLLKQHASTSVEAQQASDIYTFASCVAQIEGVIAVVSDLQLATSRIFNGAFARTLALTDYSAENSIWEKQILSLMPQADQQEKILAELHFYNRMMLLRPARRHYYLMSRLRMAASQGEMIDVVHRMYYLFDPATDRLRFAICLYGPASEGAPARSVMVNTLTGETEQLTTTGNAGELLSPRERQILQLIRQGLTSKQIAERLSISPHTVSRHRQEIIAKLQVRNSVEACQLAKSIGII